jgi:hypothetical protein
MNSRAGTMAWREDEKSSAESSFVVLRLLLVLKLSLEEAREMREKVK